MGASILVELVPSVLDLFGYYFPEGPELVARSGGHLHIVSDDGRRFLGRSSATFDLITIDPPPPVEATGSSLLYSTEFDASATRKLNPGAILQMWLPGGDRDIEGVTLSTLESFRYVRMMASFQSVGFQVLASDEPIQRLTPHDAVARMPEAAIKDLTERFDVPPARFFECTLANEFVPDSLLLGGRRGTMQAITEDRPVNELFLLRLWARGGEERPPTTNPNSDR